MGIHNEQDTAGQEIYHALSALYYRDSDFAIIVYDVTDIESFKRVRNWVDQLKSQVPSCKIALAANKCDLEWKVSEQESLEYSTFITVRFCKALGLVQFSTSAMNGEGINKLFSFIVKELYGSSPDGMADKPMIKHETGITTAPSTQNTTQSKGNVKLGKKDQKKKEKKCCD